MYVIQFSDGSDVLEMTPTNGYLVSTIKGLTGVNASLQAVPNGAGIGTAFINGTLSGQQLTVQGVILDGNVAAKRRLLEMFAPMRELKMVLYDITDTYARRWEPYRQTDVVVLSTPQITQTHHSKFAFSLYQPVPCWFEMSPRSIILSASAAAQDVHVYGQVEAEFAAAFWSLTGGMKDLSIYLDGVTSGKFLYFDFRRYDADGIPSGSLVVLRVKRGGVTVKLGDTDITKCMYIDSNLFALPTGDHTITISGDGSPQMRFDYYPAHIGVALAC